MGGSRGRVVKFAQYCAQVRVFELILVIKGVVVESMNLLKVWNSVYGGNLAEFRNGH